MRPERRTLFIAFPLAAALLGLTVVAAFLTSGQEGVTQAVETLSSGSSNLLSGLGVLLPFGFAFTAGMVSAVNPCGFVMLPAYLGLFLGHAAGLDGSAEPGGAAGPTGGSKLRSVVRVSAAVTLGFVLLFSVVGVGIGAGLRSLAGAFPWLGLGTGVLLVGAGVWLALGGTFTPRLGGLSARLASGAPSLRGYVTFGVAYGLTSLSCTLPVFLAVIGTSLTLASLPQAGLQLLLYALGMGSVIMILTLSLAYLGRGLGERIKRAQRYIAPAGALLMTAAGAYTVFYWLTVGGLLQAL